MKTRNAKDLAEQKSFYKQIEKNDGLLWLAYHHRTKDNNLVDPIEKYNDMVSNLFWFRIMRTTLVTWALVGYYFVFVWALLSADNWIESQVKFVQFILSVVLIVVAVSPYTVMECYVSEKFTSMMEAWLEINWVTKNFMSEVANIYGTSDGWCLTWLIGKGVETNAHAVPQHVAEKCKERLLGIARSIKSHDLAIETMSTVNYENRKEGLKYLFTLFSRYGILDRNPDIRVFYTEAEQQLKADQAENNLVHGSAAVS